MQLRISGEIRDCPDAPYRTDEKLWLHEDAETLVHYEREIREKRIMRFLSVCSGIEAVSVATEPLGWTPIGFSEIETFPCSVLAHHYPNVRNYGDMTRFEEWDINETEFDLLAGGTPCQSFSIAGLRGGLADDRGNLALTYCRILQKFRPKWFLWENVPGVLSSSGGRDFGSILGAMEELGYGVAYRVLDAQYFGVPQRRRRVFVVGCAGDWRRAAEVLFESSCVRRNPEKGGKKKQNVAALTTTGVGTCGADDNQGQTGHLIPTTQFGPIAGTLTRRHDSSPCHDRGQNIVATSTGNRAHCLNAGGMGRQDYETETMVVENMSYDWQKGNDDKNPRPSTMNVSVGQTQTLSGTRVPAVGVRRLTPRECERLQGFPDDYTLVTHRNKPAADGPRYKAIGNSMAVPVISWICKRIQEND